MKARYIFVVFAVLVAEYLKKSGYYCAIIVVFEVFNMKGTVKFFNEGKHFGFIAGDDGSEYFVHSSGLKEGVSITEKDSVEFDTEKGDRGLKAVNVVKATE